MQHWVKFGSVLCCVCALQACIVVPEHTRQVDSTTRVFVNNDAQNTQVEISRPQVIIIENQGGYHRTPRPQYRVPPNCHLQSNGRSVGPIPMVCN